MGLRIDWLLIRAALACGIFSVSGFPADSPISYAALPCQADDLDAVWGG